MDLLYIKGETGKQMIDRKVVGVAFWTNEGR